MKRKLLTLGIIVALSLTCASATAQYYCFWVSNQSGQTFNELKIRKNRSGDAFGRDLLPRTMITSGDHFWIKTGNDDQEMYDIRITREDGTPLLFTYTDISGKVHESQAYISVNAKELHTLVITRVIDGVASFKYYKNDHNGYGDPCEN